MASNTPPDAARANDPRAHATESEQGAFRRAVALALSFDRERMLRDHRKLKQRYGHLGRDELGAQLVRRGALKGAGIGLMTGLPANPWVALPAAAADVALVLRTEAYVAAQIGLLHDAELLDSGEPVWELMVPILGGRFASEVAREFAIRTGMAVTRKSLRRSMSGALFRIFQLLLWRHWGIRVTQRAVLTKAVPIVGGLIGGTWNYVELRLVGQRARDYFMNRPIAPCAEIAESKTEQDAAPSNGAAASANGAGDD